MRKFLSAALLVAALAAPVMAADVGVSISVGQPGFYGQINIGNVPPPPLIFARPVVVQRVSRYVAVEPIYLHVPPGHEKHWDRHCAEYSACGRPVYFVRNDWYNSEYAPRYRQGNRDERENGESRGRGNDHDNGHGHNDR
jgi:hypothetical protein